MEEKEKASPLNEFFLKAIFNEKDIEIADSSLTKKIKEMSAYITPKLEMGQDFSVFYRVDYNDLKDKIMDESQAFNLRSHGWILSDDEKNIVLHV